MEKHTHLLWFFIIAIHSCLVIPLQAAPQSTLLKVHLPTQSHSLPVYLCFPGGKGHPHGKEYTQGLYDLLFFHFEHGGYSTVVPSLQTLEQEIQALERESVAQLAPKRWGVSGASYIIRPILSAAFLKIVIFSIQDGSLLADTDINITGVLSTDRLALHKAVDKLTHDLFHQEGIGTQQILFSQVVADPSNPQYPWKAEIWRCDWDGQNKTQITEENSYSICPVSLPPQLQYPQRFLYVSYKTGLPKIYFGDFKHSQGKPWLPLRGNQVLPSISPRCDKVAFISDAGGRADLFLQEIAPSGRLKGKPQQLFSYPNSVQASPTFSPDGSQIAFVSDKDGSPRVYLISSRLQKQRRPMPKLLTKINRENTSPAWSPDGKKLAYSAKTQGVRQIWIYYFETQAEEQLTFSPGNKENPQWAKNSVHLVFSGTDPGDEELYLVNLYQNNPVRLTHSATGKRYPTWSAPQ